MRKKISAGVLSLCLLLSLLTVPTRAAGSADAVMRTIQTLGIMTGDASGGLNLSGNVTRAQFAVMLTAASSYQDSVSQDGAGYSLFRDVKSGHWASEYIRLAVQEGWMTGYTDGTFRPDQSVTLEEACASALKLLGYDSAALAGSFPSAQLNKAGALGLRDQISAQRGEAMTRQDCMYLFYNLLTAKTSAGQVYAATLGYTLTNGEVDYTSVALANLSGPYVAGSGAVSLPFTATTIYRDGTLSTSASISQYDVYYYNAAAGTIWIYTERVSGKVTALSPNGVEPASVTVSGNTYSIGSADAAYQLSALGGGGTGAMVTLLLGMDDTVAAVLTDEAVSGSYYGVVQSSGKLAGGDGNATVQTEVTVACTDGISRVFTVDQAVSYSAGQIVSVDVSSGGVTMTGVGGKAVAGTVNSTATKLGNLSFADDVEILDTSSEGDAVKVEPERLANCSLSSSDVRYYVLNSAGEISRLILNDVTGDTWEYGYMISAAANEQSDNVSASYRYVVDGQERTISGSKIYAVSAGGLAVRYSADGSIRTVRNLESVKLTSLALTSAMASNKKYVLDEEVQVYLKQDSGYYLTTLSAVNASDYVLTGYYDNFGCSAGGQIRVIVAVKR